MGHPEKGLQTEGTPWKGSSDWGDNLKRVFRLRGTTWKGPSDWWDTLKRAFRLRRQLGKGLQTEGTLWKGPSDWGDNLEKGLQTEGTLWKGSSDWGDNLKRVFRLGGQPEKGLQTGGTTWKRVFRLRGHSEKGLQTEGTLWKGPSDWPGKVKAELKQGRRLACKNVEKVPIFSSASFVLVVSSIFVQRKYFSCSCTGLSLTSDEQKKKVGLRYICHKFQPLFVMSPDAELTAMFSEISHIQFVANWTRNQVKIKVKKICLFRCYRYSLCCFLASVAL